jgi:diacylglycerol kinase family enzyme
LKVTTEESVPITLDGELIESGSFEVKVLPGALELLL